MAKKSESKSVLSTMRDLGEKIPPGVIARMIMKENDFITLRDKNSKGSALLYYHDGVYHQNADSIINEEANKLCGTVLSKNFAAEVRFQVEVNTYKWSNELDPDPNIINVQNGLLDLRTGELSEHTPAYLSTIQLPVKYNAEADCPTIRRFFSQVLIPGDIDMVEEMFGYCLLREYPYHRMFLLYGNGANGKSTLIELLRIFLGRSNCVATSLQALAERQFAGSFLYRKLANIVDDLKSRELQDTGIIKMLTGGATSEVEEKYGKRFDFQNYAKMIFAANQLPMVSDDSRAWWRRQIIINFPNEIPVEKQDPYLLQKMTTGKELSGLLNLSLQGLRRLKGQGDFSYTQTVSEVAQSYKKLSDSVSAFIDEWCTLSPNDSIAKTDLYEMYCRYCEAWKLPKRDSIGFGMRLKKLHPEIITSSKTKEGETRNCYQGITCEGVGLPDSHFLASMTMEEYNKV